MADPEINPSEPVPEQPKSKSKWIVLAGIVLLLAGSTVVAWRLLRSRPQAAQAAQADSRPKAVKVVKVKSVLHLEPFVLNLADPEGRSYLRVGIDLGLEGEANAKEDEGGVPVALVRDTILNVLSLCQPNDLLTAEGKAKLKQDLLRALRQRAPELGAREVYFTEFLVQR